MKFCNTSLIYHTTSLTNENTFSKTDGHYINNFQINLKSKIMYVYPNTSLIKSSIRRTHPTPNESTQLRCFNHTSDKRIAYIIQEKYRHFSFFPNTQLTWEGGILEHLNAERVIFTIKTPDKDEKNYGCGRKDFGI